MNIFIKKFSYMLTMICLIALISFSAVHLAPNSFFASGDLNPNITEETINQLKIIYDLDKPLYIQFLSWFINLIQLDFGVSFTSGEQVKIEILNRLPITLILNITSLFFVFCISLVLGIKAAMNPHSFIDKVIQKFSILSFSLPSFYLALILLFIFAIQYPIFPLTGTSSNTNLNGLEYFLDTALHLVLPIFVLVFSGLGSFILYIRSLTLEVLKSDYIFFARTRGISTPNIIRFYILPNLYPTVITILGLSLPGILGGSVILENIFGIDGMGLLFFKAALSNDYPIIMGILIIGAFLTLLGNILADLILLKLNPYTK